MRLLTCASREARLQGLEDFRAGRVERLARRADGCIVGVVLETDGTRQVTTADPEHPRFSLCTCPRAENPRIVCRHMVAVFCAAFPEESAAFFENSP